MGWLQTQPRETDPDQLAAVPAAGDPFADLGGTSATAGATSIGAAVAKPLPSELLGAGKTIMTCSLLAWSCLTIGMAFVTTGPQLLVMMRRGTILTHRILGILLSATWPANEVSATSILSLIPS
jgi:hypothetical protein